MKRCLAFAMLLLMVGTAFAASPFDKKDKGNSGKLLTGRVTDRDDNPLPSAVVYLSNTRTRAVKTFICGADGAYRFPALSQNDDYEIYAQLKGKKSDTKTVSQFDSRSQVNINLKIDTR
ncbi:MAG TPA: carboxypeptidase-like regulatory domain-containing protein [Terriglobales bacterium]|nr:carboxypeptidase-like regulatory domain-containing protein [Terriglobales bacterium]